MKIYKLIIYLNFFICRIYAKSNRKTGWNEVHVPLSMKQPCHTGEFSTYSDFLKHLPETYSNIKRTSLLDIVQDQFYGLELSYELSSFASYLCHDRYEIKGFGKGFLICSRLRTEITDYFTLGTKKCLKNLKTCPGEFVIDSSEDQTQLEVVSQEVSQEKPDDPDEEDYEYIYSSEEDIELNSGVNNLTMAFDCLNDKGIDAVTICSQFGIQGFGSLGYACAASRGVSGTTCPRCHPKMYCLGQKYVCGILAIKQSDGQEALGAICCSDTNQNTIDISMANAASNGNFASLYLADNIKEHFQRSGRNTFSGVCTIDEDDFGFHFVLCPPDFYVQGYNGDKLLCSKQVHEVDVDYLENKGEEEEDEECEQHICFPEDKDIDCIHVPSPKIKICKDSFISKIDNAVEHRVCETVPYSNTLHDQGLQCANDETTNLCGVENNGTVCGVVVKPSGTSWWPRGLVFCYTEEVPESVNMFAEGNTEEILYFHNILKMEKHTLTVEDDNSKISELFNLKIQEGMHPSDVLNEFITPIYKKRMWVLNELPTGGHYPETLIMCPNNSYVRGVHKSNTIGDSFKILCSEEVPLIEGKEMKILGTESVCPLLGRTANDFYSCGLNTYNEQFDFCGNGEYYAPIFGASGKLCHADPCGDKNAVCGSTNIWYAHPPFIVCCEPHRVFPSRIPEAMNEAGLLSTDAIKYVLDDLRKSYQVAHDGRLGTYEEVISYHRQKHDLARILSIIRNTDFYSDVANQATSAGISIPEALKLASEKGNFDYWIIDEQYAHFQHQQELIRAYICPPGKYARGRGINGVLCSENVPIVGKRYTTILGAASSCIMNSPANSINYFYNCIFETRDNRGTEVALFCSRGYFGRNSLFDQHGVCSNGFQCQASGSQTPGAVCGLLMVPDRSDWEKIICCSQRES